MDDAIEVILMACGWFFLLGFARQIRTRIARALEKRKRRHSPEPPAQEQGLKFAYDLAADVLVVEGVQYSGDLLRAFSRAGPQFNEAFVFRRNQVGIEVKQVTMIEAVTTMGDRRN